MAMLTDFGIVASIIVIIISIVILIKRPDWNLPHKILLSIFFVFLFTLLGFYALLHDIDLLFYAVYIVYDGTGYILGPLFYIYIKSLYQPDEGLIKSNFLHFVPFALIAFFVQVPQLLSWDGDMFKYLGVISKPAWSIGETYFQAMYLLAYCIASFLLLKEYRIRLKNNYSNLERRDLRWVQYLIAGIFIVMSLDTIILSMQLIFGELQFEFYDRTIDAGIFTVFAISGLMCCLAYFGITQSKILFPDFLIQDQKDFNILNAAQQDLGHQNVVHHLSNSSPNEINMLKDNFENYLSEAKPYLNEDLTLGKLADGLEISDKKLSALLNHYLDTNFHDLINEHRVKAFKEKLKDENYSHYTLLSLAYDCGFKSKSSFNRIFKKNTGISPSKYKSELNQSGISKNL